MANIPEKIKQQVRQRAGGCCEYCLSQEFFSPAPFSVEHIIPASKDGDGHVENLALACQGRNGHKYNKTHHLDPLTQTIASLYHPRKDSWQAHFAWSADFTKILGLTPTGRATISCLKLNRAEVVNLRQLLVVFGEHPPRR
ncbi:MAG: HNH endonuclease [Phaeodactylibacter sp.]|nr:HNH endonuclease [Phaeodactylibacter sp.]MCB9294934.1 HNH endonuclease [Lewinellaceae bacterium]